MERCPAAILAADEVDYSALMEADAGATLEALRRLRDELFGPMVAGHRGKVAKSMGDGWLVEFSSAVDAVTCALQTQDGLADHGKIALRMGIHIGDVVHADEDVFGDGVNIAASLEALAYPGAVVVSDAVFGSLDGTLRPSFNAKGDVQLKNIDRTVRIWCTDVNRQTPPPPVPREKPTIAVLALENMSAHPEHRSFGDGLAEEIIATLSKISSLTVIARTSSFVYKGQTSDLQTVGRQLGVQYILEGSIRAAVGRVRVTAHLSDTETGAQVWAERYDRPLEDVFAVQDEITREIVTALRVRLSDGEQAQLWLGGTDDVEAWGAVMAAHELILDATAENFIAAGQHLQLAISRDPRYAEAHAMMGYVLWMQVRFGFVPDVDAALARIAEVAAQATALDPSSALALSVAAGHAQMTGDGDRARALGRRSVECGPGNAMVRMAFGRILVFLDSPDEAEEHLRVSLRLNPHGPVVLHGILANALERQGKSAEALAILGPATELHPDYLAGHLRAASLLGLAGDIGEAARHVSEIRRLRPGLDRAALERFYGADDAAALARFVDGLARAGLAT